MIDLSVASLDALALRQFLLDSLVRLAYREGDFTLSSGKSSHFYIDSKQVTLSAEGALAVGRLLLPLLPGDTRAVAGLTLGADPIVCAVGVVSAYENRPLPALIVRKEAKGHGTRAYIEGPELPLGVSVVVLEDVVTTGKSAMLAVERLRDAGYRVERVIALVDREQGGEEFYRSRGLGFQAVFTLGEIRGARARKASPPAGTP
jgi:orotate phosphoribosyltransferase